MTPFDFGRHVSRKAKAGPSDPLKLFESLDRKTSHTTLRPAQEAALKELHERAAEPDLVLKMPTGTGKTTVGLLHLWAQAARHKKAVVYLCPTVQLCLQVLEEADRLGIRAHEYPALQSHPNPECLSGEAVTVCTYDKLFNGKTTFNRMDVNLTPAAIVLDDAHAGVEIVRSNFTLTLRDKTIVEAIRKILDGSARTYAAGPWDDLQSGRPSASSLEIPYWLWKTVAADVRACLAANESHDDVKFQWPHLKDLLHRCRCVVASHGIEVLPPTAPVERVRAYRDSEHRLFMSATLADDAVLVRELGCQAEAALRPVAPAPGTFGERLVLVPSLIDRSLNLEWVKSYCQRASDRYNVVVLCASEKASSAWAPFGATVVTDTKDVPDAVAGLKSGKLKFVAFMNRYDGVDLPDDACRILVLDGLPTGQGIADAHDGSIRGAFQSRIASRIEQGMGRAVRSHSDWAVVILAGPQLATFTAKPEVRAQMSADARAQIELAHELPKLAQEDGKADTPSETFRQMVKQCVTRSPGWRHFYDERIREAVKLSSAAISEDRVQIAAADRLAAVRAYEGDPSVAATSLQSMLNAKLSVEQVKRNRSLAPMRAYYLQLLASYVYDFDPGNALEMQRLAHDSDRDLLRPPILGARSRLEGSHLEQTAQVLAYYAGFPNPQSYLAQLETVRALLSFESSPAQFEEGLKELAPFLGAEGLRPEQEEGAGPDDLFVWSDKILVIEAKNDGHATSIPKSDAAQLLHSMSWFASEYKTRKTDGVPVVAARTKKSGVGVHLPDGTRVLLPALLDGLLKATAGMAAALAQKPGKEWRSAQLLPLLQSHRLTPTLLIAHFTEKVE